MRIYLVMTEFDRSQYCEPDINMDVDAVYTIITRRAILSLNGSFGLISKRIIPANTGAFVLEKDNNVAGAEPKTLRAFSFAVSTSVNPNLGYSITYQTKNKYNEQDLTVGSTSDSDVFLIGAGLYNEAINGTTFQEVAANGKTVQEMWLNGS
jgi:hypothetical protein